jgi:hypothetical protein
MPGSIRSGPSSPGRAILSQDAVFSVDALCKCGKTVTGALVVLRLGHHYRRTHQRAGKLNATRGQADTRVAVQIKDPGLFNVTSRTYRLISVGSPATADM